MCWIWKPRLIWVSVGVWETMHMCSWNFALRHAGQGVLRIIKNTLINILRKHIQSLSEALRQILTEFILNLLGCKRHQSWMRKVQSRIVLWRMKRLANPNPKPLIDLVHKKVIVSFWFKSDLQPLFQIISIKDLQTDYEVLGEEFYIRRRNVR